MPAFGRMSDWLGRRPTLLLSLFFSGTGSFLAGFTPNLTFYFVAQGICGTGQAIGVVCNTYLSDVVLTQEARALWFSRLSAVPGFREIQILISIFKFLQFVSFS